MGSQNQVMQCYEQIAVLTASMLQLARAGSWDALASQEVTYRARVEDLKGIEPVQTLDAEQVERKYRLLCRILADDAEIRDIITPELGRLGKMLGAVQRRQTLQQAYGQ
jgi:flagellar protein FliT